MEKDILLFDYKPKYDTWVKLILGSILALTFILGIVYINQDTEASLVMFGITLFDVILFKLILPNRFQIFENKVKIMLGWFIAINIPLTTITEVKIVPYRKTIFYGGLRLAMSSKHVVEIKRKKGMDLVISPTNQDMFVEELNEVLQAQSSPNI